MKVLVLKAALKHADETQDFFCDKLAVFFDTRTNIEAKVDNVLSFDVGTLRQYDTIVFAYTLAAGSVPSELLEFFEKMKPIRVTPDIYALGFCEEFEPSACAHANDVIRFFSNRQGYHYRGSLNIGSRLVIRSSPASFVVTNYLKMFSNIVKNHQESTLEASALTRRSFLNKGNRFWKRQIAKRHRKGRLGHEIH